jgi:hypothetical protein
VHAIFRICNYFLFIFYAEISFIFDWKKSMMTGNCSALSGASNLPAGGFQQSQLGQFPSQNTFSQMNSLQQAFPQSTGNFSGANSM